MLTFSWIAVGDGEGLGCARCAERPSASYAPTSDVIAGVAAAVGSWGPTAGPNIILGGPEPFGHPELPAIVAACVEAGVERIGLETDGGALSVAANATGVLHAGVRHLRIRVLAGDERLADELTGIPQRTRDAFAGVGHFLAAAESAKTRVAVTAVVPVCRHNLEVLPATVLELARRGFHAARLVGDGALPSTARALIAAACDTGMVNRLWVEVDQALPLLPTHRLHAVAGEVLHG